MAFTPFFAGGIRVAGADLNGDGFGDVIVGAGPGGTRKCGPSAVSRAP